MLFFSFNADCLNPYMRHIIFVISVHYIAIFIDLGLQRVAKNF